MILAYTLSAAPASAQTVPVIGIGSIASEQQCTTYKMSAGSGAIIATPYGIAAAASWRTWLERDCVDNFASLRESLTAALAASGKLRVTSRPGGRDMTISATISGIGTQSIAATTAEAEFDREKAAVSMTLTLRDGSGKIVDGFLVSHSLETGSGVYGDEIGASASLGGRTIYAELERGIARAAARMISFKLVPLQVISVSADEIGLNYGSPLLGLGTLIRVQTPEGKFGRFRVVAAGDGVATAEPDGDRVTLPPGSRASVIENDDPAANGRRMRRSDLPG